MNGEEWAARIRNARGWLGSAAVVVLCLLTATMAVAYASSREAVAQDLPPEAVASDSLILVWLLGCALAVLTIWRRRWPELLIALSTVAALLLPLDPTPALVGWVTALRQHSGWRLVPAGVLTVVATVAATHRDGRGTDADTSLWQVVLTAEGATSDPLSWLAVLVISGIVLVLVTALGIVLRVTGRNRELARQKARTTDRVDALEARIERHSERERLAREVHDALGHRLSLLSLHAGALQTSPGADAQVRESARLIQDAARQSVQDLQTLLAGLRAPDGDEDVEQHGLHDIRALVDEAIAAGAPVVGVINQPTEFPQRVIGHTAFRVAQEVLTNARRHAPGVPVRLDVTASSDEGIEVVAVNALLPDVSPGPQGHGLTGLQERVALMGGRSQVGVDEDQHAFRVAVWLPWESRP